MEKLIEFLKQQPDNIYNCSGVVFKLENNKVIVGDGETSGVFETSVNNTDDIKEFCEEFLNLEVRFCNHCGCPICECFMDGDSFYSCAECFPEYMDEIYGKDKWRASESDEEGESGGYYDCLEDDEWLDTGIFWTELE